MPGLIDRRIGLLFARLRRCCSALAAPARRLARRRARAGALKQRRRDRSRSRPSRVPAPRGTIIDRNGTCSRSPSRPTTSRATPYLVRDPSSRPRSSRRCSARRERRRSAKLAAADAGFVYLARRHPGRQAPEGRRSCGSPGSRSRRSAPRLPARLRSPRRCSAASAPTATACRASSTSATTTPARHATAASTLVNDALGAADLDRATQADAVAGTDRPADARRRDPGRGRAACSTQVGAELQPEGRDGDRAWTRGRARSSRWPTGRASTPTTRRRAGLRAAEPRRRARPTSPARRSRSSRSPARSRTSVVTPDDDVHRAADRSTSPTA